MTGLRDIYSSSLALFADGYALTAPAAFWREGLDKTKTCFYMHHRKTPYHGGYAVMAGLQYVTDWMRDFRFDATDLAYLAHLTGNDDRPLFDPKFLTMLQDFRFSASMWAMPEGTVVFPNEPMIRMEGTVFECLLAETFILNTVNFQTLIASKASRVVEAADGDPVLEFGARRAQGIDGALAASRACYIGGASSTSLLLAGKLFGIPVKGTHPHAFVMFFDSEVEAFAAYARAMPANATFLVDTYNTIEGVKHAIDACKAVIAEGFQPIGIRLDSGDLAYLSIEARRMLDAEGLQSVKVFASNDLDEHLITSLKQQGAQIAVWGVGTKMSTGGDQSALGGVWKMSAKHGKTGWEPKIKLSEQSVKTSIPGRLAVRRFKNDDGVFLGDMIHEELDQYGLGISGVSESLMIDPADPTRRIAFPLDQPYEDVLVPIFKDGVFIYEQPTLQQMRERRNDQVLGLHAGIRRLDNPHQYPVGLERQLHDRRTKMILEAKGISHGTR